MRAAGLLLFGVTALSVGAWLASCGPAGFQDEALVNGVRILATRADHPYAKPGETVTLSVLAVDGRTAKPEPMVVYWFPIAIHGALESPLPASDFVCEDPTNDAYYQCFASYLAAVRDAGVDGGGAGDSGTGFPVGPGVDLAPFLPKGPTFAVPLSRDIISKHPPVSGTDPYGIAIVFNMACAGHPELVLPTAGDLSFNALPIGCFDKSGNPVDNDGYVVGYATIYAYDKLTNDNPVIRHVLYQGKDLDAGFVGDSPTGDAGSFGDAGVVVPACTDSNPANCPVYTFDIDVPDASWQVDPQDKGADGQPMHEQIWVDYYWTTGIFSDDSRLVYDPSQGAVGGTAVSWNAPSTPTAATFWAVVHDNRGGVSWDIVPYTVK